MLRNKIAPWFLGFVFGLSILLGNKVHAQTMTVSNGLKLWLKADVGVVTNADGTVIDWMDQISTNNAIQTVANREPILVPNVVNGLPAIKFDGTNDYLMTNPIKWPSNDYSYFTVFQKYGNKPSSTTHIIFSRGQNMSNSANYFALINSTTGQTAVIADAVKVNADVLSTTIFTTNIMRIVSVVRHDKVASGTKIYVDGNYEGSSPAIVTTNAVGSNYPVFIGGRGSNFGKVKTAELLIFNRALSDSERMTVEDYLALKYNLPMDADGDGMPDDWEKQYGFDPSNPLDAGMDADGDGFTNLQEFQNGTDPNDYFNGVVPVVSIYSGSDQSGFINTALPDPLIVSVTTNGAPYANAPVIFSVMGGGGSLTTDTDCTSSLSTSTGPTGLASVNFNLSTCTTNQIQATVGTATATFYEKGLLGTTAIPTFSPDSTNEFAGFNVTVSCDTLGSIIYYTMDGSEPNESSSQIASGSTVLIDKNTTLKAIAFNNDYSASTTKSGDYQVLPTPEQTYRNPLTTFTSFTKIPTNIQPVTVGSELFDGWIDKSGGFYITNYSSSYLAQKIANTQRTNFLARPTSEAKLDQTITMECVHRTGSYGIIWPRYNESVKGGYRLYVAPSGAGIEDDVCTNSVLGTTNFVYFSGGIPALGTPMILSARAIYQGTGTTIIAKAWLKKDWQMIPQGPPQAAMTNFFLGTPFADDPQNPVAISLSKPSSNSPTIQNVWVYDESATATLPTYNTGSTNFVLAYLGSSTWVKNSTNVPTRIHSYVTNCYPTAVVTTINGAIGGTTTVNFLPGQAANNALKSSVQAASGKKILRMMIGSNDAKAGVSLSTWLANMQTIIDDARTWPVDDIILEEIGVRLDGGYPCYNLIKQYNEARSQLIGARLGGAQTFDDQSQHLNLLSSDNIHQNDTGGDRLAQRQAAEIIVPSDNNF